MSAGGIAPLIELARGGTDGAKKYAARALRYLALNNATNQAVIAEAGWQVGCWSRDECLTR